MKLFNRYYESLRSKHIYYRPLIVAALSWPWIWITATGGWPVDIVDMISLGMIPALIISAFIAYKETKSHTAAYKFGIALALAAIFILVWMIPAVGIKGRSGDPADLIYYCVPAIGIIIAILTNFRPSGMVNALAAMTLAQILVAILSVAMGWGLKPILNGGFTLLWAGSAFLFKNAVSAKSKPDLKNFSNH